MSETKKQNVLSIGLMLSLMVLIILSAGFALTNGQADISLAEVFKIIFREL